jgi:amino acid permease
MVAALVVAYALKIGGLIHADLDACLGVELGEGREQCRGDTHLAIMNMDTVKTLTVYIFAFTCHQNIFGTSQTPVTMMLLFFSLDSTAKFMVCRLATLCVDLR